MTKGEGLAGVEIHVAENVEEVSQGNEPIHMTMQSIRSTNKLIVVTSFQAQSIVVTLLRGISQ